MVHETKKLMESKNLLLKIASGINPLDDSPIQDESFLHNPQVIRPLFFLTDYISYEIERTNRQRSKPTKFNITDERLALVDLPSGSIGINEFAKVINAVIDPSVSKKITGAMINKKLKEKGILSEEVDEKGHRTTITNGKSEGYGIESETRTFNGREYQKILFNEIGKKFLLKNFQELMQ
ncbi:hypothetical protein [Lysinibacillus sp. SGAir0095]|uniref:hypothetical protein n=1 Tax=Lysinibacillus sp. SGAir0095 TaxID=2070463 RepID=UPI0010CD192D|nr:hypothetical protein [Lysinibacillus sp. SGAir0095]QCR30991.1 hypothetical protein C1N55_01900 [Lysinibacillus sp. SGAir0095]